jgi:hypothetical protein
MAFARALGFAQEEKFVILALAAGGGTEPLLLMASYAMSVSVSLIGMIVPAIKVYRSIELRVVAYMK